jgi:Domain of unknown function DUF11
MEDRFKSLREVASERINTVEVTPSYNEEQIIDLEPVTSSSIPPNTVIKKPSPLAPLFSFIKKFPFVLPVAALAIISIFGTVLWFVFNTAPTTKNNNVTVQIQAPKEIPIGSTREWVITVKNSNKVPIFDTRVNLLLDQNFKYQRDTSTNSSFDQKSTTYFLKTLAAEETRIIRFEAQVLGAIQETSTLQVKLQFSPQSTKGNEFYEILSDKTTTTIVSSDINASITKESELVEVNSNTSITFKFENISDKDIENIRIRGIFPSDQDFAYSSSKLDQGSVGVLTKPTESNNIWVINKLPKKAIYSLTVSGKVLPSAKTEVPFTFEIASLSAEKEWKKIIETYIAETKEFFKPSAVLTIIVEYENKSTKSIPNIELTSSINDPAGLLDYTKLAGATGTPNITGKTVVWKGANLSDLVSLSPGVKGSVKYTIPVKSKELALNSSFEQDRYVLQPVAEARQDNKQSISATSQLVYKLEGGMNFVQKQEEIKDIKQTVFGNDTLPFKVVRVTWEFTTLQNEITSLEAKSSTTLTSLFEPVWNPLSISPADYLDKVLYGQTGDIVFRQDTLPNYLGISKTKLVVSFDIKVPDSSAINGNYGTVAVLGKTTVTAKDAITAQDYKFESPAFTFSAAVKVP